MRNIFLAGHSGMVGGAILERLLQSDGINVIIRSRYELDLTCQKSVLSFFESVDVNEVIICAAKVGGIFANATYPADFIYENLQIQNNLIHGAHLFGIQKLLFLGSSCIYPKLAPQPMAEDVLLSGYLEPTNAPYAIAKIAGIKMCESYHLQYGRDYRSVMPTNLYGPGDNYHLDNSHVIPALIRRFHEAKENGSTEVVVWGSGNARREFLYVKDMAEASLLVHNLDHNLFERNVIHEGRHVNIGCGHDMAIKELANLIKDVVGYQGSIIFDANKPDGAPRKLLDTQILTSMGWSASTPIEVGLEESYIDFCDRIVTQ